MRTFNLIAGLVGAAAAGVIIGMMVAPKKGTDLRREIARVTDNYLKDLGAKLDKGRHMAEKGARTARSVKEEVTNNSMG